MKTREEAEARALELYPIHEEFDFDRLKPLREAYLQGWEDSQQNKQTCGFCIEPATELTNEKHSESLDTKENEGSELPSEKQKEHCEAGCKNFYGGEILHHKDCVFYPESITKQYSQLREAAEKVLKTYRNSPTEEPIIEALQELEKALR